MITLKYWNSLSTACRQTIVGIISNNSDHDSEIIQPYHHNLDYDITGKKLKIYLSKVFLTKDKKLKIFTEISPTFTSSNSTNKKNVMHRYYFRMYTKDDPGDGKTIWEEAYSESEARNMAYSDFHSITELDLITVE